MARGRRRGGKIKATGRSTGGTGSATRSEKTSKDDAARVYDELLSEAAASPATSVEERPIKKRKIDFSNRTTPDHEHAPLARSPLPPVSADQSAASESSDEDWEQVELEDGSKSAHAGPSAADDAAGRDISVDLSRDKKTPTKPTTTRRLPPSNVERKMRLQIHKLHLCCLLAHIHVRNAWCNIDMVQMTLKPLLHQKTIAKLNPDPSLSQVQRSRSFIEGLEQACGAFRDRYQICARGLSRPAWSTSPGEAERVSSRSTKAMRESGDRQTSASFLQTAQDLQGSRDTGAQLYCALLRSARLDARLVCSLQVLPFGAPAAASTTSAIDAKPTIVVHDTNGDRSADEDSGSETDPRRGATSDADHSPSNGLQPIRRFGASDSAASSMGVAPPPAVKKKPIRESSFPVFWVEAFNSAIQKWISVDPLVTKTVARPSKLEAPAADTLNGTSYVVAFEDDGTVKDVTRRYAKAYNAKTRKTRVESTKDGEAWFRKVMAVFDTGLEADRDQVEDAELAKKEASEPMPRNVQDFKDHPIYALERHLRRHEVISPKKEVGILTTSRTLLTSTAKTEPIYRRRDVQHVKSADKWFRTGREVKAGEQPLKYAMATSRRVRRRSPSADRDEDQDEQGQGDDAAVGLYAESQTSLYIPPPVVDGKVPRNVFGNLDVPVPSMIPPGGVHVRASEAAAACKIVGVDYADAVTGFKFAGKGRGRAAAVIQGVVVAAEHADAVEATVLALRWQEELALDARQAKFALALWKRFMTGLRIRERVMQHAGEAEGEGIDPEKDDKNNIREEVDEALTKEEAEREQGGFLPDRGASITAAQPQDSSSEAVDIPFGSEDTAQEQRQAYLSGPICVPSPWNKPPELDAPAVRQSNEDKFVPEDHLGDTFLGDDNRDDGGGGFLKISPEEAGGGFFPSGSEEEQGGGFVPPNGDEEAGAGFLPAGVEDQGGGGFLPPDVPFNPDETGQGSSAAATAQLHQGPGSGRDQRLQDVRQAVAEAVDYSEAHAQIPSVNGAADADQDVKLSEGEPELQDEDEASPRDEGRADEDEDSLMSHDPEDEDAEPAWLAG